MPAVIAPSAPVETPTQDAPAPQVEESTTAVEAAPETPPGEGTETAPPEQRTTLPEAWQQHPDVAAWASERLTAAEATAAKALEFRLAQQSNDLKTQHARALATAEAAPIVSNAKEVLAMVRKGLTDQFDDAELADAEFHKWLGDNDGFARVMADQELEKGRGEGHEIAVRDASVQLYEGLSDEGKNELYHYVTTDLNARIADQKLSYFDAYKQMRTKRDAILRLEVERDLGPAIEARLKDDLKAYAAAQEPGVVKVAGRSGNGKSDAEVLLDPNTPVETIMEIRARQKSAG